MNWHERNFSVINDAQVTCLCGFKYENEPFAPRIRDSFITGKTVLLFDDS